MPKPPIFADPQEEGDEDILDSLTAPARMTPRPAGARSPAPAAEETPAEPPAATPERPRAPAPAVAPPPTAPAPPPEPNRSRRRPEARPRRQAPNVSLYLTAEQKRELMRLKIDLGLDYTEIVLDSLKARHPGRRWGI